MSQSRRVPFSWWRIAVGFAQEKLARPVVHPLTRRHPPVGDVVARFAIPLALCPTTNDTRERPSWWHKKHRDELFTVMAPQFLTARLVRGKALPGRPQVRCVRFSSVPTDPCADWAKTAVDRLILPLYVTRKGKRVDCKRFGILADDTLEAVDEYQWWEPAPPGEGCAYIEIRTGE